MGIVRRMRMVQWNGNCVENEKDAVERELCREGELCDGGGFRPRERGGGRNHEDHRAGAHEPIGAARRGEGRTRRRKGPMDPEERARTGDGTDKRTDEFGKMDSG